MPDPLPFAALLRRLAADADTVPDGELLGRFVRSGDAAAFELLVWRHGGLVWDVCRRMLAPDRGAAEDACQATFLALATRAGRVRDGRALAGWLHRVAVRACLDLIAGRRPVRPLVDRADRRPGPAQAAADGEVRALLDAGVNRLPERYRLPFVLCELEGLSNREAAAVLGCAVGTVESRLTRARQRLRRWLSERGVSPAAAVPASVRAAMVRVALPGSAVAASVRALADRAVRSAAAAKLGAAVAAGLLLVVSAAGFGLMPAGPPPAKPEEGKTGIVRRVDADGLPLPAGAVARLGSSRLRHGSWVKDVCFSADGKRLASVGHDNAVRVWDAATGRQLFAVSRDDGGFDRVAFAPGGQIVVAAGRDRAKKVDLSRIDVKTGVMLERLTVEAAAPEGPAIRFSADGARLAIGDVATKELLVIDAGTGRALWKAATAGETPGGVAFAANGNAVAVATTGGRLFLFGRDGQRIAAHRAEGASFKNVAVRPDGAAVVAQDTAPRWRTLVAWEWRSGTAQVWRLPADYTLLCSPDGKTLVCSAYGFTAAKLDPTDRRIGANRAVTFESMVEATCAAYRPDGKVIAFGTIGGVICLYDSESGKPVAPSASPPHEVRWLRFSPDGTTLYGWAADWFSWDIASGKQARVTNAGWNYGVPLSPDGTRTVRTFWTPAFFPRSGADGETRLDVCDVRSGAVLHSSLGAKYRMTESLDFTPDGKGVVAVSQDNSIFAWEIAPLKELVRMTGHQGRPQYRAVSADGRVLVTATLNSPPEEFPVRAWDLKTGRQLAKLNSGVGVGGVAASGDGRRLAALAYTNAAGKPDPRHRASVWDVASGKLLATVPQGGDGGHVALSPDGRLVAVSASWGREVGVFEVAGGGERFRFRHDGEVTGLAFAPGGKALAAASKDAPVILWDVVGALGEPLEWSAGIADRAWDDLADEPRKAFAAMRRLRAHPAKALPLLRERAKLPAAPGPKALAKLLGDLDADALQTRDQASATLASYGEVIRGALEAELQRDTPPEAHIRLRRLIKRLDAPSGDNLRLLRAVEVVEAIGSAEARALLEAWAGGSAGAAVAAEAKAALARRRER